MSTAGVAMSGTDITLWLHKKHDKKGYQADDKGNDGEKPDTSRM